ncbi:MAG TPA: hypothetical protein PKE27_07955 [Povalibacter sp.]|uniref:hypothetical protein n=1 Tax=Povalibacter sp. TaxID=1962978 RepID=UPI002C9B4191|nr:hypothetical protein [Povalibacter sp.]HMN44489.1 hypothetical protein [Povalibacter sp.]
MTHPAASPARTSAVRRSIYDDMPLSQVLFRYLWPFWLFKNASVGDRFARAAAYTHNRQMRIYLPGYLLKWLCNCIIAFGLTALLGSHSMRSPGLLSVMAAGAGVLFTCGLTVLFVIGYIYVYLSRNGH